MSFSESTMLYIVPEYSNLVSLNCSDAKRSLPAVSCTATIESIQQDAGETGFSLEKLKNIGTMLIVAHRLSTVKNADEIVVLDSTGVVERGTHDELIENDGEYKKLYLYQFRDAVKC